MESIENSWFVVAGKTPSLTKQELIVGLGLEEATKAVLSVSNQLVEIKTPFPDNDFLNKCASFTKAGVWHESVAGNDIMQTLYNHIIAKNSARYDIGISVYDSRYTSRDLEKLALSLKKKLKTDGHPVRMFYSTSGTELSSVITQKQLLGKGGREFILVFDQPADEWRVGEVLWSHYFEDWSAREFGKTHVDKQRGMLPHKLARAMINLSGQPTMVYDPFCGSGAILIEARHIGLDYLGSDLDPVAVSDTQANLGLTSDDKKIWQADAQNVEFKKYLGQGQFAIVTEPTLGPAWSAMPSELDQERVAVDLAKLYAASLKCWRSQIPKGTQVVMALPVIGTTSTFAEVVDRLGDLGYSVSIKPIRYERDDQFVRRDIVRLTAV